MRLAKSCLCLAVTSVIGMAIPAFGNVGDSATLQISGTSGGPFIPVSNSVNGDQALAHTGSAGDASRVYWTVPNTFPSTPELYTINWLNVGPENGSVNDYQPFESQFDGGSETFPYDSNIPWGGQFGTNHQWISNNNQSVNGWQSTGPGPQTPGDANDTNANNPPQANGLSMWLKAGSEIYVKWDFSWYSNTTNIVSDLMITQVTPEPASLSLLALGAGGLLMRRRRMA